VRLILVSLHPGDRGTWMNTLAIGEMADGRHAMLGLNMSFPLSVWILDSTGRWHAARPDYVYPDKGDYALTLRLVPPLARSATWIEVLAAGRSAGLRPPPGPLAVTFPKSPRDVPQATPPPRHPAGMLIHDRERFGTNSAQNCSRS
jgi:hypothetical protein